MKYSLLVLLIITGCRPDFPVVITEASSTFPPFVRKYCYNGDFFSDSLFNIGDTITLTKK